MKLKSHLLSSLSGDVYRGCDLDVHQAPFLDHRFSITDVLWVRLSAKMTNNGDKVLPLASSSKSGEVIDKIELGFDGYMFGNPIWSNAFP